MTFELRSGGQKELNANSKAKYVLDRRTVWSKALGLEWSARERGRQKDGQKDSMFKGPGVRVV